MNGYEARHRIGDAILFERAARRLAVRFHESTLRFSDELNAQLVLTMGLLEDVAAELRRDAQHLSES